MKSPRLVCVSLLALGSLAAQPVTVPMLGPRFKQTRERAEVLFGRRNGAYPRPDAGVNLFQSPAETVRSPDTPEPGPVGSDEMLLSEAVAVLKRGGGGTVLAPNGSMLLSVAGKSHGEGDSISVPLRTGTIDLRIIRISGKNVTLRLNQSEAVLRF
jgi:hypothetical protein